MELNKARKQQNFFFARERLFTKLFTCAAVIGVFVVIGLITYNFFSFYHSFLEIGKLGTPQDSWTPQQQVDYFNLFIPFLISFEKLPFPLIAWIIITFGIIFLTRVIANILHIVVAAHDAKTIMVSKKNMGVLITKYIISTLAALAIAAALIYASAVVLNPLINQFNGTFSTLSNDLRTLIPSGQVDEAWLRDQNNVDQLNAILERFNQELEKISNTPTDWDTWKWCVIALAIGIVGSLLNQLTLGITGLVLTKNFKESNQKVEEATNKDKKQEEKVEEKKPEEKKEETKPEETKAEEVKSETSNETKTDAAKDSSTKKSKSKKG